MNNGVVVNKWSPNGVASTRQEHVDNWSYLWAGGLTGFQMFYSVDMVLFQILNGAYDGGEYYLHG